MASFSEGDDYSPIYLLFFHPSAMERLIVYLKVDPDLVNSPEEVVTDVLRAEILRVMRNGYNQ